MTKEENIRAILECLFTGFKDEIIDEAVKKILTIKCDDTDNVAICENVINGEIVE